MNGRYCESADFGTALKECRDQRRNETEPKASILTKMQSRAKTDFPSGSVKSALARNSDGKSWSTDRGKRVFDLCSSLCGLILLSPVFLIAALLVRLTSRGPILFRQTRVGKSGRNFTIYKFRSMCTDAPSTGPSVTRAGDKRLTRIGGFLRRSKLDELPQLINVVLGDMSLVGPRPKVPHHQTCVLHVRPGITGAASLAFRREEDLIRRVPDHDLDRYQVQILMPLKQSMDDRYAREATFLTDLLLIRDTILGRGEMIEEEKLYRFQQSLLFLNRAVNHNGTLSHAFVHPTELALQ